MKYIAFIVLPIVAAVFWWLIDAPYRKKKRDTRDE